MSDEVLVLREQCEHKRHDAHPSYIDKPYVGVDPPVTYVVRVDCPGGRELRLKRVWVCVYGHGRQVCTKDLPHPTGSTAHRCREMLVEVTDE